MTRQTDRLLLRPLVLVDCARVRELASDPRVARWTRIPHPYPDGAAAKWIAASWAMWERRTGVVFAICRHDESELTGAIGLHDLHEGEMELGFWLAEAEWGQGLMTEAVRESLRFAFANFAELQRIFASCMHVNLGSMRVLQKAGFEEGPSSNPALRRFELLRPSP